MKIILIGPPGAGKGTQAQKISQMYGLSLLSTGMVLRKAIQAQTALGNKIKDLIDNGHLVPDLIVAQLVENHIKNNEKFLLDGYPRNLEQAIILDKILEGLDFCLDAVIKILLSDEIIRERLLCRKICPRCGWTAIPEQLQCPDCCLPLEVRSDDNDIKAISSRLEIYHSYDSTLSEYYQKQNVLYSVDGSNTIDEVFKDIQKVINGLDLDYE